MNHDLDELSKRITTLECKINLLLQLQGKIDRNLEKLEPLYHLLVKLPFFKK